MSPLTAASVPQVIEKPLKIVILVPLSGLHEEVGKSLLQAAQMAFLRESNYNIELVPLDTRGTEEGALEAYKKSKDASVILGPLTSAEVRAIQNHAPESKQILMSFSNDRSIAGKNTIVLGPLPDDQVQEILNNVDLKGKKIGIFVSNNAYGQTVSSLFSQSLQQLNALAPSIYSYTLPKDIEGAILPAEPFDVLIIPEGGASLEALVTILQGKGTAWLHAGTQLIGLDPWRRQLPLWVQRFNHVFASLPRDHWNKFSQDYQSAFLEPPHPLAGLAHDAVSMAVHALRQKKSISLQDLQVSQGFAGVYGIYRITSEGVSQRLLELNSIRDNAVTPLKQPPVSF